LPAKADEPPDKLIAALKRLPRQKLISDQVLDDLPGQGGPTLNQIGWGDYASEVYLAFSRKMDSFEDTDRQRFELGMRASRTRCGWRRSIARTSNGP
jgi:hypothetical protein